MKLYTKKRQPFYIDEDDYDKIRDYTWYMDKNGYLKAYDKAYYKKHKKVKKIFLHRLIMNAKKGQQVDHIDINPSNNRRCNLRFCNSSENHKNTKPKGRVEYLGVYLQRRVKKYFLKKKNKYVFYEYENRFIANIVINGKQQYIGSFKNKIDAAKAYDEYAKKYHGEFANLNFK